MFQVGDLIRGKGNYYGITDERSLCEVVEVYSDASIRVRILAHVEGFLDDTFTVNAEYFEPCTLEEFLSIYPDAEYLKENEIKFNNKKENKTMNLKMNKESIGNYTLTTEERETLRTEIIDLLEDYNYNPTEEAVNKIIDEWVRNKGWMINLFKKHPNYNGKFQIVFDTDYSRCTDKNIISTFASWVYNRAEEMIMTPVQLGKFSYKEVRIIYSNLNKVYELMTDIGYYGYQATVNGKTTEGIRKERDKWMERFNSYRTGENIYITGGVAYSKESYNRSQNVKSFASVISGCTEHIADEDFAYKANRYIPEVKAVAGQKVSRIINKICRLTGIDKHPDYNREFAKYSDAINPLSIKRHTILSCHPVDYLTMSFGNSWASCHTIDKNNRRHMPDNYSGCYSSGTLSYMLDGSSFVYYTVDKSYDGNEYELQDKINRNMFHMGEDKLIQARVYPQATDGETGIYKQIREIAQKVIADCLEVPNMWKNVKGTGECSDMIRSYGTHYTDYTHFSDCNVSYLKGETEDVNRNRIHVGHEPICPSCGRTHSHQEAIECERCYNNMKECSCCGHTGSESEMHYIDGEYYCDECSFYCEYHEQWEAEDCTYVEGYGSVCDDALDDEDIYYCEHCERYFWSRSRYDNHIRTEDGTDFCGTSCAERDGYIELDGCWYPEDDVFYCEHCNTSVHRDDWNSELECCTDCEEEVAVENAVVEDLMEEMETEREAV